MVGQKTIMETKNKMLDLTIGKTYKFKLFVSNKPFIAKVKHREERSIDCHLYWISWWDEKRKQEVGHYIYDYGYANQNRTIVFNEYSIKTCEEVCI